MTEKARLGRAKWGKHLIITSIATTCGAAVPLGYKISQIQDWCIQSFLNSFNVQISPGNLNILWSAIVSIFLVGGAIGSLGGLKRFDYIPFTFDFTSFAGVGWAADYFGRKRSMLIGAFLFIVSAILFFFCRMPNSVIMLIIARLIVGIASGLTTSTLPMYMEELSPLQLRGTLGVLCPLGITLGVIIGQIGSKSLVFIPQFQILMVVWKKYLEHLSSGTALSAYVVLVIVCMLPYYWFPESPKYLFIILKDHEAAKTQLKQLRGSQIALINEEIQSMENEAVLKSVLPVFLVCALLGGQQLSGINTVFFYSVSIFERTGLSSTNAKWANLGTGCVNILVVSLSPYLMTKVNRRPLVFWSTFVSGIVLTILTVIVSLIELATWLPYVCIVAVFGYIIALQLGLGPIPGFIGTELFESAPRPAAMALGSLCMYTANFIVGMAFPSLQVTWGAFVFLPFAVFCFALAALLKYYLPETRGRDASEVAPLVADGFKSKPLNRH